jgi:two-component system chemotaxis response regulator CheB
VNTNRAIPQERARAAAARTAARTAPAVVAVASSAGGVSALQVLVGGLPADFPAAMIIVQHVDPRHESRMPELLARRTSLTVRHVEHGEPLLGGCVYVAPPDRHVRLAEDGTLALSAAAPVLWVRPSADVLFDSVARAYGPRAAAVVLTGTGRDGAAGCVSIHNHGGRVIVQDVATSEFQGMPQAAVLTGDVDALLPLNRIACELVRWAGHLKVT